jgi:hypothetical protein
MIDGSKVQWDDDGTPAPTMSISVRGTADSPSIDEKAVKWDAGPGENFVQGMGAGLRNLKRGIEQRTAEAFGSAPMGPMAAYQQHFQEAAQRAPDVVAAERKADAPIMDTFAGKAGAITGAGIPAALLSFLPGGSTLAGSVVAGAGLGAAQPTTRDESVLQNTALGGVGGAAGYGVGQLMAKGGQALANRAAGRQMAMSGKDAAAQEALSAGYALPPSQVNPTTFNRTLEGISGKIATGQAASVKNQKVTQELAAKAVGLTPEELGPASLATIRKDMGNVYEAVKQAGGTIKTDKAFSDELMAATAEARSLASELPEIADTAAVKLADSLAGKEEFSARSAIDAIKKLRRDSTVLYKSDDPEKVALAAAKKEIANAMEDLVERNLEQKGMPDLMKQFREARTLIAKTHSLEAAMKDDGTVVAAKLAKQLGRKPLTGELAQIAKANQSFPKATQDMTGQSTLPISPLDVFSTVLGGSLGGIPGAGMAAASRPLARGLLLSGAYQSRLGAPSYNSSVGGLLQSPITQRMAQILGTTSPQLTQ